MEAIFTLHSGYTIDLKKLLVLSGINEQDEFTLLMDYDTSMTFHGNNNEGIDINSLHTELLQAWKDFNAQDQT